MARSFSGKKLFTLSCVFVSVMNAAYAEEEVVTELPPITVTAGRGSNLEKLDVNTSVITKEQVQQSPETTVEQILNKIPGVFSPQVPANQIHPTGQVFSIRGFGTTTNINTLVMIDGIPVNDPYFRILNWGAIPKDSIERIEVIRGGGASSMWGNLAMGGIVNIVLREPAPNEKRINLSYGSFNTKNADVAATVLSNDKLKIGANLGVTQSDGYLAVPEQYRNPIMVPTASHSGNLLVSAYFTPSSNSKYYLKASGTLTQEHGATWSNTNNSWDKQQLTGGGTTKLSRGSVNMNGWVNTGEMDTQNAGTTPGFSILTPTTPVVPYASQIEQAKYHSLGGSLFYQEDASSIKDIKTGVDLRSITAHDNENFYNATAQTSHILIKGEHRFQGIFAQGTYRPASLPVDVTVGLREDLFQTVDGSIANEVGATTTVNPLANKSYTQFDPRIGAKYYFENGLNARAAMYRNFAAPGMNQMYRSTQSGTNYLKANPNLVPQDNLGKEIGFDYSRTGLDVAFTLFHNQLDNYIDYAPVCTSVATCASLVTGTGFNPAVISRVNQYVNAGNAVLKGAELIGNWQATEAVQLNGGLTRTIAYLTSSAYPSPIGTTPAPDPINEQLGQVPGWMATLGSQWQATPTLKLSVQFKSFPEYANNTAHTQKNSSATLADLGFTYKANKTVDVYGSAQNIGNRSYYDSGLATTTMNGSTISGGTVPALGMPLNVNVGVRAAF